MEACRRAIGRSMNGVQLQIAKAARLGIEKASRVQLLQAQPGAQVQDGVHSHDSAQAQAVAQADSREDRMRQCSACHGPSASLSPPAHSDAWQPASVLDVHRGLATCGVAPRAAVHAHAAG